MKVPAWGCPWHGKVQGASLTLPDGQQMAWPQPDEGVTPDDAGFTLHAKMPGVPEVERTADEQALDELEGWQWLNSAIIAGAGANARLHGKAVGGWIYAAPDGSRWLVKGLGPTSVSSGIVRMNLTLVRFGVLGGAPASISASASRSISVASGHYWQVQDINEGGSKAIMMIYAPAQKMWPRGFMLLEITGQPGVDLSATLTTIHGTSVTPARAISNAGFTRLTPWHAYREEELGHLKWRVYTGSTVWLPEGEPGPALHVSRPSRLNFSGTSTFAASWPVSVFFNDVGEPQTVYVRIDKTVSMRFSFTSTMTGADGPYGTADERVFSERTVDDSIDTVATIRIFSGSTVRGLTVRESFTNTGQQTISNKPGLDPEINGTQTSTGTRSGDIPSESAENTRELRVYTQSLDQFQPVIFGTGMTMRIPGPISFSGYSAKPHRWSNNLISVEMVPSVVGVWSPFWTDAFSPSGTFPGSTAAGGQMPKYGSYNPITGEAVIGSATPVSWT